MIESGSFIEFHRLVLVGAKNPNRFYCYNTWNIRTYLMKTKDDDRSKNPDPHWVSVAFLQAHIPSQKRIQCTLVVLIDFCPV